LVYLNISENRTFNMINKKIFKHPVPIIQFMEPGKKIAPHHIHLSFAMIIVILMIIALLVVIKPAMFGYKLGKQFEDLGIDSSEFLTGMASLESDILVLETKLDSCGKLIEDYLKEITDEKNATFTCLEEKRRVQSMFEQLRNEYRFNLTNVISGYEQGRTEAELELNQLKIEFKEIEAKYERLVKNTANNICCKARIDNPEIDSFIISNDKVVCSIGEEKKVEC